MNDNAGNHTKLTVIATSVSQVLAGHVVYKQLLDEVFVISRIVKVEVGVISRSRRLRLITLTESKKTHVYASSLMASKTKRANLT